MRVIECAELIASDLFRNADQTRARITFGDVERDLAQRHRGEVGGLGLNAARDIMGVC